MNTTHIKTLTFVVGALIGIVVGYTYGYGSEIAVCALLVTLLQGVLHIFERKRCTTTSGTSLVSRSFSVTLYTFLFSLGLFLGLVRVQFVNEMFPYTCDGACTITAVVTLSPETKNEYQVFTVRPVDASRDMYDVEVRVPLYPRYEIGETLSLSGKVTLPKVIMPHGEKKVFDYKTYLATHHIGSGMYYPGVEVVDEEAHDMVSMLGRLKEHLVEKINMHVASPASSLATGMLFGNSSMSQELTQTFRTAGLSHIIVLSGFNIAVVIAFVLVIFSFLPLVLRISLASITAVTFVLMVGGEASVIRATLMAFVSLLATLVGRKYVAHQALILSLFAIVMYEPQSLLYDVSLHLSFLATAGIVYLVPILELYATRIRSKTIRELCVTTGAAYLATLPYIMYTFGTVSIYALISNILSLSLVPPAMLLSFITVVMSFISETLSVIFGYVDTVVINVIITIARAVEVLPFASIDLTISFHEMILIYVVTVLVSLSLFNKNENETEVTEFDIESKQILTDIIKY